jgi:hypothetical protein
MHLLGAMMVAENAPFNVHASSRSIPATASAQVIACVPRTAAP